jgi:hypothetical protein
MTDRKRGRPAGTARGFSLQDSKWRVAFAIYVVLISFELPKAEARALAFSIMVNPRKGDARAPNPVQVSQDADGRIHFRLMGSEGRLRTDNTRRFEFPMASGKAAWLTFEDFGRAIKRLDKNTKTMSEGDAAWLCKAGGYVMRAALGVDADVQAEGWYQMRQIAGDAILPAWEPLAASEAPYIRYTRMFVKHVNASKAARSN